MNKQNFKVGDRVVVTHAIGKGHHNGQTGTIIPDKPHIVCRELGRCVWLDKKNENGRTWIWCLLEEIEPIETKKHPVVVITSDGKTTTATMREGKKVLKTAMATCSDKDTFDFAEGARIAFERLQGRDPFPAEKKPKPPEKVICVSSNGDYYVVGKIYKLIAAVHRLPGTVRFRIGDFGVIERDGGYEINLSSRSKFWAKFIPLVED